MEGVAVELVLEAVLEAATRTFTPARAIEDASAPSRATQGSKARLGVGAGGITRGQAGAAGSPGRRTPRTVARAVSVVGSTRGLA